MPRIGFVAKLSDINGHKSLPELLEGSATNLIPGRATNKLMCGITCRPLVSWDFEYASADRKATEITVKKHLEKRIGFAHLGLGHAERGRWETLKEAVKLLCKFLPVLGSNATTHYFWCWAPARVSTFHLWEGRHALWQELTDISEIQEPLSWLKYEYPNDFYTRWDHAAVIAKDGDDEAYRPQKQMNLRRDCRDIWNWTTTRFEDSIHGFTTRDRDENSGQTRYMHLVAAHCVMSCTTIGK